MPELPEVDAIAHILDERMRGLTIEKLMLYSIAALKTADPPYTALAGREVRGCSRAGKFLVLDAEIFLVIHLARAGWIRWSDSLKPPAKPSMRGPLTAQLRLHGGAGLSLTEHGTEKRLSLYVVSDPTDVPGVARLGIDVMSEHFTPAVLEEALKGGGNVKAALADQSRISGVGNAYSDDILHAARMSPFRSAKSLSQQEVDTLHTCIVNVISEAVARARALDLTELKDDKRSHMRVHRRDGLPCPVCGDTVRSVYFSNRSLQYCPTCQTGGKVLADRRMSRLLR